MKIKSFLIVFLILLFVFIILNKGFNMDNKITDSESYCAKISALNYAKNEYNTSFVISNISYNYEHNMFDVVLESTDSRYIKLWCHVFTNERDENGLGRVVQVSITKMVDAILD